VKERKVPLRKCVGCQEMKPKGELIRVVRNKENETTVDFTGKKPGRGAYICKNIECFRTARKRKSLERAFASKIDDAVYEALEAQLRSEDG